MSDEEWYKNRNTTQLETKVPVCRFQLTGHTSDDEIRYAWKFVAENFGSALSTTNSSKVD